MKKFGLLAVIYVIDLTFGVLLYYPLAILIGEALIGNDSLGMPEKDFGWRDVPFRRSLYLDKKVSF